MPFLSLNGLSVPVVEARRKQVNIGSDSRAFGGAYRLGRRAVRQEWEFKTGPLPVPEAAALRGLISGDGHALSFDGDTYSSRGLGQGGGGGVVVLGGRYVNALRLPSATSATWGMQLGATWTTLHHRFDGAASTWRHFVSRSDGLRWMDGAPSATGGGLTVSSGSLTLLGAVGLTDFDDVVALPFLVPDAWLEPLRAWHVARPWSALPYLSASGDFVGASVKVLGEVRDGEFVEFVRAGVRVIGERFDFTLREV
ncbi:hypothetical protein DRW03_34605 [Corallococcus sp. H22C18031201]|nr:hypothetical protein DRW03_34605 [Corallococcus sp. H22C18031201]